MSLFDSIHFRFAIFCYDRENNIGGFILTSENIARIN